MNTCKRRINSVAAPWVYENVNETPGTAREDQLGDGRHQKIKELCEY